LVVQPTRRRSKSGTLTAAFGEDGTLVGSGPFSGLRAAEGNRRMTADAAQRGFGEATVQYRLKDWGVSRQRYWGTPIPIIHCRSCGMVPVPDDQLPCCCRRSWNSPAVAIRRSRTFRNS
jgi:leucyl-tRNA synthetase